jgi:uncharacterized protein (DUF1697 family)
MLRGINLGGHNRVAMQDLRGLFAAIGFRDVVTYVQSGNVVFSTSTKDPWKLATDIEMRISKDLGLDVTVVVRTGKQLAQVLAANSFIGEGKDTASLHVTLLTDKPEPKRAKELAAKDWTPDEVRINNTEAYLFCPNGYGRTKLQNAFLEKQLDTRATTRNWKTVTKLAELANG